MEAESVTSRRFVLSTIGTVLTGSTLATEPKQAPGDNAQSLPSGTSEGVPPVSFISEAAVPYEGFPQVPDDLIRGPLDEHEVELEYQKFAARSRNEDHWEVLGVVGVVTVKKERQTAQAITSLRDRCVNELFAPPYATEKPAPVSSDPTGRSERYRRQCLQRNRLEYWSSPSQDSVRFGWALGDRQQSRVAIAVVDAIERAFVIQDSEGLE